MDIALKDRQNEYLFDGVCQNGCDFVNYDYDTKKVKCSCDAKESSSSFAFMKIDKKNLLDTFNNEKKQKAKNPTVTCYSGYGYYNSGL